MSAKPKKQSAKAPAPSAGEPQTELILYQAEDGKTRIDVRLQDDTVWLTQKQMSELFQKDVRTVNEHIQNLFEEKELAEDSVIRKFRITAADGKIYETMHYNLDDFLRVNDRQVLQGFGKITAQLAKEKADRQFDKFDQKRRALEDAQAAEQFAKEIAELEKEAKQIGEPPAEPDND